MSSAFLDYIEINFEILVDFDIIDYIEINVEILIIISVDLLGSSTGI